MKKYILGAVFSLALLASPALTHAGSLTNQQIQAILSLLQSFGAESGTIANVSAALNDDASGGGGTQPWCHTFNKDLTIGSSGNDVFALDQALRASGIPVDDKDETFTENTAAEVVQFQAKYGIRQTGYVGPVTRAKLNSLYGCGPSLPPIPFNASPTSGSAPLAVTFVLNYPMVAGPYAIDYGDGTSGLMEKQSCPGTSTSVCLDAIHTYTTPGSYTARVSASGAGNTVVTITVTDGTTQPTITVLSPNGGEQWQKGSTQSLTWNPTGAGMIDIRLVSYHPSCTGRIDTACPMYYVMPTEYVIANQTANDGVFEWGGVKSLDGREIPEGKYTIRISRSIGAYEVNDESDAPFSIVASSTQPSITVLSPNGGETLIVGKTAGVGFRWDGFVPRDINIRLYSNDTIIDLLKLGAISTATAGDKPFSFDLPSDTKTGSTYRINVCDDGTANKIGKSVCDTSDTPFSIVAAPPVSTPVTLSSVTPASGPVGTSVRLDGCGSDSSNGFTLVYTGPRSGTAVIPVETLGAASGCGYMTFTVPSDFPTGAYTLSVKNNQTGAMSTNTKTFTVTNTGGGTGSATACTTSFSPNPVKTGEITTWNFQSGTGDTTFQYSCSNMFTKEDGTAMLSYGSLPLSGSWRIKSPGPLDCTLSSYNPNVTGSGSTCRAILKTTVATSASNPGLASALGAFDSAGATPANPTPQSTSGFNYTWTRDLQIGSPYQGDIIALQQALTLEGVYTGELTGGFYNQTYTAVQAFQRKHGIDATGYVGLITRAKLNTLYSQ